MTDRPILFSGPMVRALLEGRKTQTRRVFKPRGFEFYTHPVSGDRYNQYRPYRDGTWDESRIVGSGSMESFGWGESLFAYLPYAPGDRLWVRENIAIMPRTAYALPKTVSPNDHDMAAYYQADFDRSGKPRWRPSIHMPRWASRITLIVTDVRVQRLQEISWEDAKAEGVSGGYHQSEFASLWDSLNASRGYGWDANPWVCAITFEVIKQNIDQIAEEAA